MTRRGLLPTTTQHLMWCARCRDSRDGLLLTRCYFKCGRCGRKTDKLSPAGVGPAVGKTEPLKVMDLLLAVRATG